ncbi:MAG: YdcF family protein [Trueperaceae bacterium]|nr:YdcF family protein [Trueperaceae bacterium]
MFAFQKIAWWFLRPSNLLFLLLLVGVLLLWFGARRNGRALLTLVLVVALVPVFVPVKTWLRAPLENHFPVPSPLPDTVDGIIVLGGAVVVQVTASRGQVALGESAERMTASLALARQYPEATLLFSGGSGELVGRELSEADVAAMFYEEVGLEPTRLLLEQRSRDTYENALYSYELADPQPGQTWLLVTSAMHMPRAVGVFQALGWPVLPYPVDFRSVANPSFEPSLNVLDNITEIDGIAREWVGLVAFRLLGRTDALFPTLP